MLLNNKLEIEYVDRELLVPYKNNPRKHSEKQLHQLRQSIQEFGFITPILVDENNTLIAGHARLLASTSLNMVRVPVIRVEHLTKAQKRAYIIADNKLALNSEWDNNLLAQEINSLQESDLDFDLGLTAFSTSEMDIIMESIRLPGDVADEVPIPEVGEEYVPVTQLGDVWKLGSHVIVCADATSQETFSILMKNKKAVMVFIDPPYNVKIKNNVSGLGKKKHREFAMASGEMKEAEFINFLLIIFMHLKNFSGDGSIHFICMDWRHQYEILIAGREVYTEQKNLCVWNKDNAGMGSFYRSKHELIFVFKNGKEKHRNNFELGQHGRYRTNVWDYAGYNSFSSKRNECLEYHPTVKPVGMIADAIMDCSKRGDIVLDCFLGSGSTLLAAERTGRVCYGVEIDPTYMDVTIKRWQQATGKNAVHVATDKTFNSLANKNGGQK